MTVAERANQIGESPTLKVTTKAKAMKAEGIDVIDLSVGEPDFPTPENIKTALEIGVQAELDNIAMYEAFLEEDLPEDVRDVFERLMAASKNHLEAFRRGLQRYGQT